MKIANVKNENSKSEFLHFLDIFFKCFTKRNKAQNLHAKNAQIYTPNLTQNVVNGGVVVWYRILAPNAYIIHLSTFPMIFMLVSSPASMR
ncbi:MAG: hypothetical protein IJT33_06760 [Campylobacter sp.]|nr:hypothetical protein [Campylobacter sp.]